MNGLSVGLASDVMRWTASARGIFVPKCGC